MNVRPRSDPGQPPLSGETHVRAVSPLAATLPASSEIVAASPVPSRRRFAYIDNLRWLMIVLVISMHATDTYSPLGNWYYTERPPIGIGTLIAFAVWQTYLQSFFMGLLFFIAGVFTPPSIDRKGPARFLRDRATRLGTPLLFYMLVIGPVTEYYIAHSWTAPYSFAHEWWHHIADLEVLQENGPLWFLLALLIFSSVYAVAYRWRGGAPGKHASRPVPDARMMITFALVMAAGRFLIRFIAPGAVLLNMHVGDFAQYILLFGAGIVAARSDWLGGFSVKAAVRWAVVVLPIGFATWVAIVLGSGALRGGDLHDFGWHWESAAIAGWESFTCVAMCMGLITLFRERFDAQGRVARFLSDNAFSVYVFHPPIVIVCARLLHGLAWTPGVKVVALTALSAVLTFVASALVFRRIPVLRAVL